MSWSRRNSASSLVTASNHQPNVDEASLGQRPLLDSSPRQGPTASRYGSIDVQDASGCPAVARSSRRSSPEVWRRDSLLNQVPEEESSIGDVMDEPEAIEWSLEEQGLYTGA